MESHYTKIYTGNFIIVQLITTKLENVGIVPILKDEFNIGLSAVLVKSYNNLIDIYVHEDELEKAIPIIESVKAEIEA